MGKEKMLYALGILGIAYGGYAIGQRGSADNQAVADALAKSNLQPGRSANGSPDYNGLTSAPVGLGSEVAPKTEISPAALVALDNQVTLTATLTFAVADRDGSRWALLHPDEDHKVSVDLPTGFTPDKRLHIATDVNFEFPTSFDQFKDWETAVNTKRAGGPLAGYNYDYNDFCQVPGFRCNVQGDMFGWRIFQGQTVEIPGIGRLEGGPRRSVVVIAANRDGSVQAWDNDSDLGPVYDKHGFTATGRIFDADNKQKLSDLYTALSGHWLFRQFNGTPEKSYVGITDSSDNAREVLIAVVQRVQWGFNPDQSKRMEWQLVRAALISASKSALPTSQPVAPVGK